MKSKLIKIFALFFVVFACFSALSACNQNNDEEHIHNYNLKVIDEQYLASNATCESPAKYYFACSCLEKGVETFENGNALGHAFGEWSSNGDGTHSKNCANDDSHIETESCSGGQATENNKPVCQVCNGEYGSELSHQHVFDQKKISKEYEHIKATCVKYAEYYYSCLCGAKGNLCFTVGNYGDHDYGAWKAIDNGMHKRVCKHNTAHFETQECYGGIATCENEAYCVECGNAYKDKLAHKYTTTNVVDIDPITVDGELRARKTIVLTCEECNDSISATATAIMVLPSTCQLNGYTVFEYTYRNLEDKVETFIEENSGDEVTHALGLSGLAFVHGEKYNYTVDNIESLREAFNNSTIKWATVIPISCTNDNLAMYNCRDCGANVVIYLTGEHMIWDTTRATCLEKGISTCKMCGWSYESELETGHNYKYVIGSFNTSANTAQVKCACGDVKTVNIAFSVFHESVTCKNPAYTTYTTVVFDNGLDAAHKNYATKTVSFNIDADIPVIHNIGTAKFVYGADVEYTPEINALIEAGKIEWTVIGGAPCNRYFDAVFACDTCGGYVVIQISGEHTLDAINKREQEAGCITRGYVKHYCTACSRYIEVSATDAKGHNFIADQADLENMIANSSDYYIQGKTVTFNCACGKSVELGLKEVEQIMNTNPSSSTNFTCYTFEEYRYFVETASVGINKEIIFAPFYVIDNI